MRPARLLELRGDEALSVFGSARDAIDAAVALQQRFVTETVRDADMPLLVGIGIDVGEAVPVEGGYRGGALNLAARLCSLAAPGEILASPSTTHLAGADGGGQVPSLAVRSGSRGCTRKCRWCGCTASTTRWRLSGIDGPQGDAGGRRRRLRAAPRGDRAVAVRVRLQDHARRRRRRGAVDARSAWSRRTSRSSTSGCRPPTPTRGCRLRTRSARSCRRSGVLLLSQHVETDFAVELVSAGAQRLGYLLKDRVANIQEFTDAVRRVGAGGSVIDPEVVSTARRPGSAGEPARRAHRPGAGGARPDGRGRSNQAISRSSEPVHQVDRGSRAEHLHEARPPGHAR